MRFLTAILITLALTTAANAQQHVEPGAASPYPGAATYADLVRLAVPDLTEVDGRYEGSFVSAQTNLFFPDAAPAEGAQTSFTAIEALPFASDGNPHLALLVDSENDGPVIDALIVINLSNPPRLVAFSDITADQHTGFDAPALFAVGVADDGLLLSSAHFNSNQGYKTTVLAGLFDGRIRSFANVFTLREHDCGVVREQIASFVSIPISGLRFEPFAVTVTEATLPSDDECSDIVGEIVFGTRAVATTYFMNQDRRYQPDSSALDELYVETEKRF